MSNITHYDLHLGSRQDQHYKATLFQGQHLLVGINCLDPGQHQPLHDHPDADKVYFVAEGSGWFTVGQQRHIANQGAVVWVPAGVPHAVEHRAGKQLVLLVCIAPPPGQ